ncbi:hypothetical protein HK104_004521, partial [Borealophlyctis nickersoniae]
MSAYTQTVYAPLDVMAAYGPESIPIPISRYLYHPALQHHHHPQQQHQSPQRCFPLTHVEMPPFKFPDMGHEGDREPKAEVDAGSFNDGGSPSGGGGGGGDDVGSGGGGSAGSGDGHAGHMVSEDANYSSSPSDRESLLAATNSETGGSPPTTFATCDGFGGMNLFVSVNPALAHHETKRSHSDEEDDDDDDNAQQQPNLANGETIPTLLPAGKRRHSAPS